MAPRTTPSRSRQLLAIAMLPGTVTLLVPGAILSREGVPPLFGSAPRAALALVGVLLAAAGVGLMARTIRLFFTIGQGTLAPWDPTRRLVVQGVYRRVRNPMISGVMAVLLGEAAICASGGLFVWFLCFAAGNAIYMPRVEEPGLERRFGADYLEYKRNVPRWIPRLEPWDHETPRSPTERRASPRAR
jgi:protein-S-isoprenylcysteine O-methyltransferase Ste14